MRIWILQRYQTYARMTVLAALFLSAIWFSRGTVDVFDLTKITILWFLGLISLALWVISSAERGVWVPKVRLFWLAGAFLAVEALATVFSMDRWVSFLGLYHRYGGLIPFCLYATIALILVGLYWERPEDLKEIPRAFTLAAVLVTGYVLIEKAGLDWIPWRDSNGNPPSFPVSTLGNSDFAGGWLAITAPLVLYSVLTARNRYVRFTLWGLLALDMAALWFTQSRGAFIALGAVIAAVAFLYRDKAPAWVRWSTLAAVIFALGVGVVAIFHPGMRQAPALFSKAGAYSPFRTGTFQSRSWYWITALRIFKRHPILGTGPDTYFAKYPKFRLPQDGASLGLTITDKPHNIFLEYAADSGFLGIATYLALVGTALWYAQQRVRKLDSAMRLLLTAFVGMLVAYLAQGFFSIDIPPLAVLGWVSLAGIAVLADPGAVAARERIAAERAAAAAKGGTRTKKKKPGPKLPARAQPYGGLRVLRQGATRWPVHVAAVVLLLVLLFIGSRPFRADAIAHDAQVAQGAQGANPQKVAAMFLHASALLPVEPSYISDAGSEYESTGDAAAQGNAQTPPNPAAAANLYALAATYYRAAWKLQPQNVFYVMNLGRLYGSWAAVNPAEYAVANRYWIMATRDDPTDYQVHLQYSTMLNSWANATPNSTPLRRKTIAQLVIVVKDRPDQIQSWVNLVKEYQAIGETTQAQGALQSVRLIAPNDPSVQALEGATGSVTPTAG